MDMLAARVLGVFTHCNVCIATLWTFLCDALNYVPIEVTDRHGFSRVLRKRDEIAIYYLKRWFLIDLISVLLAVLFADPWEPPQSIRPGTHCAC